MQRENVCDPPHACPNITFQCILRSQDLLHAKCTKKENSPKVLVSTCNPNYQWKTVFCMPQHSCKLLHWPAARACGAACLFWMEVLCGCFSKSIILMFYASTRTPLENIQYLIQWHFTFDLYSIRTWKPFAQLKTLMKSEICSLCSVLKTQYLTVC